MEEHDYDFKAEYAKSNRASCKCCSGLIAKDSLRLAIMVQVRIRTGFTLLRPESESSDSGIGIAAVPDSGIACPKSECCADSRDRYICARHF